MDLISRKFLSCLPTELPSIMKEYSTDDVGGHYDDGRDDDDDDGNCLTNNIIEKECNSFDNKQHDADAAPAADPTRAPALHAAVQPHCSQG